MKKRNLLMKIFVFSVVALASQDAFAMEPKPGVVSRFLNWGSQVASSAFEGLFGESTQDREARIVNEVFGDTQKKARKIKDWLKNWTQEEEAAEDADAVLNDAPSGKVAVTRKLAKTVRLCLDYDFFFRICRSDSREEEAGYLFGAVRKGPRWNGFKKQIKNRAREIFDVLDRIGTAAEAAYAQENPDVDHLEEAVDVALGGADADVAHTQNFRQLTKKFTRVYDGISRNGLERFIRKGFERLIEDAGCYDEDQPDDFSSDDEASEEGDLEEEEGEAEEVDSDDVENRLDASIEKLLRRTIGKGPGSRSSRRRSNRRKKRRSRRHRDYSSSDESSSSESDSDDSSDDSSSDSDDGRRRKKKKKDGDCAVM